MKKKSARQMKRAGRDLAGAAGGAAAGAVVGAIAGPAGVVVGAMAGAAAGALAMEEGSASQRAREAADRQLDEEIGVSGGDLGAKNLKHPPAKIGAYSIEASGAVDGRGETSEGPIPPPEK